MNPPSPKISIYLIDDENLIRAGMRALLERAGSFEIVGDCGDAREGIERIGELHPDLAILDISMPGMSGLDAVEPIKAASPRTRVLMASHHERDSLVVQALEAGADGYLSKSSKPEELTLAILAIHSGETFLSPRVSGALLGRLRAKESGDGSGSRLDTLTPREREVFQAIAIGKTNKEIAAMLALSVGTVKKHRENLQRKLDCHSAAEIARLAIREGLLDV